MVSAKRTVRVMALPSIVHLPVNRRNARRKLVTLTTAIEEIKAHNFRNRLVTGFMLSS